MKKRKCHMRGIAWLLAFALIGGSVGQPVGVSAAKKPKLNKKKATIRVGKTVKLKVKNAKGKVKWSTSNKKVASVNKKGLVKGKKKGKAKITAKVRGRKLTCKIVVKKKKKKNPVESASVTASAGTTATAEASPTKTPESTRTPDVTNTPELTEEPTEEPTASPEESATSEPTASPDVTDTPEPTEEPTEEPTATPEETWQPEYSNQPEITPMPTYQVEIAVRLDGEEWMNHGKTLRLRKGEEAAFCEGFKVTDGTYAIYDGDEDTGCRVTVNGEDTTVTMDYYTVTFMESSTDKISSIDPQILLRGERVKRPENPGRNEYKFTGWFTEADGADAFDFDQEITQKTDIYAGWESDPTMGTYQVIYHYEKLTAGEYDEVRGAVQGAVKGSIVTAPLRASEGFSVTENPGGETKWTVTIPYDGTTGIVDIYYKRNTYTLTWELNGGSVNGSTASITEEKRYGETITAPECKPAEGYEFVSWNQLVLSKMPAKNQTYVAQYREKVTSLPGESSAPVITPQPTETVRYEVTVSLKKDDAAWTDSNKDIRLKRSGDSFYYDVAGTASVPEGIYSIYDGDEDTGRTLTVKGTAAEVVLEYYTVSFMDGTTVIPAIGTQVLLKGERAQRPSLNPGKAGYRFRNWVTEQNGTTVFDFSQRIEAKTDIYAAWDEDSSMGAYRVIYRYENAEDDGYTEEAGMEQGALVGSKVTVPVPARDGFAPQVDQQTLIVTIWAGQTEEIVINYKRNIHTLTWKLNGGSVNGDTQDIVQTVKYGAKITAPDVTAAEGYEYTGWDQTILSSMPDYNVTYTAQYRKLPDITPSETPDVTDTPGPTASTGPTEEPTTEPTDTPESPEPSGTVTEGPTTEPTESPVITIEPTEEPTPAPTATVRPTATPLPTKTATAPPTKKPSPTPIITPTPTKKPTPTPIPTPTPTPEYQVTVTVKASGAASQPADDWAAECTKALRLLNEETKAYFDAENGDGRFTVPSGTYTVYNGDKPVGGDSITETIYVANEDKEIELQYYSVGFYDGTTQIETIPIQWILEGETPEKPADPGKKGYKFLGWYTDGTFETEYNFGSVIVEAKNIYAKFEQNSTINTYQLKYNVENLDGSFTEEDGPIWSGTKGEIVTVEAPEREGFTPDENTKTVTISSDENVTETVTFTYTRNTYILTWNLGAGSKFYADTQDERIVEKLRYGEEITPPDTSAAAGYQFVQWDSPTPAKVMPATDLTYTAEYERFSYTIYWEDTAGAGTSSIMPKTYHVETETITLPTASQMTRAGYKFLGWTQGSINVSTKLPTSGGYVTSIPKGTTGDLQLIAQWEIEKYSITWDNGGADYCTEWQVEEYTVEDAVTLPTSNDIGKLGYTFAGWKNGAGQKVTSIPKGTTGNLSLTAQWTKDTYTITWNDNGGKYTGSATRATTYQVDTATITLPTASQMTWAGHTFLGWTDGEGYQVTSIPKGSDGNITLKANWDFVGYRITWDNDGGICTVTQAYEYVVEDEITMPTAAQIVKKGYTFNGWTQGSSDSTKLPTSGGYVTKIPKGTTGNITLKANWSLTVYKITYNDNGGTYTGSGRPTTYTMDTADITLPTASEMKLAGYNFTGWNSGTYQGLKTIAKGSTGDYVLEAQWSRGTSQYTINHYQENLDQSQTTGVLNGGKYYTLKESEKASGVTEAAGVYAPTKTYSGFTAPNQQSVKITADGKAVVNYYYSRNSYTVTWNGGSGSAMIEGNAQSYQQTVRYGATYTPPKKVTLTGKEFTGWKCTSGNQKDIAAGSTANIEMPAGAVVYQAQWKDAEVKEDTYVVTTIDAMLKTEGGDKNMGRSHTLRKDDGTVVPMNNVPKGTYQIWYNNEFTGETLTVDKNIAKHEIYYCEVRFFNKQTGAQITSLTQQVRMGTCATEPKAPAGQIYAAFNKKGSNNHFDFSTKITNYTDIEITMQSEEEIECYVSLDVNAPSDANVKLDPGSGWAGSASSGYYKTFTSISDIINVPDPYDDNEKYEFAGWVEDYYGAGEWDHLNLKVSDIWDDVNDGDGYGDPGFVAQWVPVTEETPDLTAKSLVIGKNKVTIGMNASELGTPSRTDTATQGCDVYIFNKSNYKQYYMVYVSGGKVVGFATMSRKFRFSSDGSDEIKYGGSIPSGFSTMTNYAYNNAHYAEKNGMHIALYEEGGSAYAIQVFDTGFKAKKDDVFKCENIYANGGYTTAALTSAAKQMKDWANAYRVNAGLAPFAETTAASAQYASDVLAGKRTKPSGGDLIDKYGNLYDIEPDYMFEVNSDRSPDALGCIAWMLDTQSGQNRQKTKDHLLAVRDTTWSDDIYYVDGGYSYGNGMTYGVLHFAHY